MKIIDLNADAAHLTDDQVNKLVAIPFVREFIWDEVIYAMEEGEGIKDPPPMEIIRESIYNSLAVSIHDHTGAPLPEIVVGEACRWFFRSDSDDIGWVYVWDPVGADWMLRKA